MRALLKKNFQKSPELSRFLKEMIDEEEPKELVKWAQRKSFLLKTRHFKIPVELNFKKKIHLVKDKKLMRNLFLTKLYFKDKLPLAKLKEHKESLWPSRVISPPLSFRSNQIRRVPKVFETDQSTES